eukprot:TRINITY_DN16484_c0_g1_i6.p1 TRINITY_DN16484_c0_g1~~TRINITY_DN16484_c0_g1_i6.p1  ORF type:complete len:337 (-),score=64.78 TRINITY_DN16484_c0_g1_i6:160-1170(-)
MEMEMVAGRTYSTPSGPSTAGILQVSASDPMSSDEACDWDRHDSTEMPLDAESLHPAPLQKLPSPAVISHFKHVGLAEHASVASFSRTVLDLMEHAAPAWLLERTLGAASEEVGHAQMAFALVRGWTKQSVQLTGFDGQLGERSALTLPEFAQRTIMEACVGETPAVLRAALSLRFAGDPHVRKYLEVVLKEERAHAELAWATVHWSILRSRSTLSTQAASAMQKEVETTLETALLQLKDQAARASSRPSHLFNASAVALNMDDDSAMLLHFGVLPPDFEAEVARLAAPLLETLRSELVAAPSAKKDFEAAMRRHFDNAIKSIESRGKTIDLDVSV